MALKVVLADDEILVRLGIKSLIDWERHGFEFAGDAPDGLQALELIERTMPDIVLTDIVMPNMDGIELIETVKQRYPFMRIIVLSSHNEYDYIRKAMKLGVDDYILKTSMKPEELLELLLETADKITASDTEWKQRLAMEVGGESQAGETQDELAERLYRYIEEPAPKERDFLQDEQGGDASAEAKHVLMLLRIHRSDPSRATVDSHQAKRTLLNLLHLELTKWTKGNVIPYKEHEVIVWIPLSADSDQGSAAEDTAGPEQAASVPLLSLGQDLISAAKRFLNQRLSIGISREAAGERGARTAYREAKEALERYFFDGTERVYLYEPPNGTEASSEAPVMTREIEQRLKQQLELMDEKAAQQIVRGIFDNMAEAGGPLEHNVQIGLQLLHVIQTAGKLTDEYAAAVGPDSGLPLYKQVIGFETLEEARSWFERLIGVCCDRVRNRMYRTGREDIQRLLVYMRTNYMNDLSLKQAADMVSMSESYLSHLFKKETDTGFTEYLNQVRIDKAAELLLTTSLPSYLIAEQVGYENINYFGRIFKKVKGISPQQYRSQYPNDTDGASLT